MARLSGRAGMGTTPVGSCRAWAGPNLRALGQAVLLLQIFDSKIWQPGSARTPPRLPARSSVVLPIGHHPSRRLFSPPVATVDDIPARSPSVGRRTLARLPPPPLRFAGLRMLARRLRRPPLSPAHHPIICYLPVGRPAREKCERERGEEGREEGKGELTWHADMWGPRTT
uniref:Uncharacterized protein n=1 Tax=Oryza sativa subsp. japonica TaxID=39947 RepID=Q6ESX1_ORYSJ|nr:hypothetical protein [Oryza sativa Japonica Group]